MADHNEIGKEGEVLAKAFLMKQGFLFIGKNFRTKFGEIDLIMQKDNKLRFIEAKTIKVRDLNNLENLIIRPEDNLTYAKHSKFKVSVEIYLNSINRGEGARYQLDLACVYLNPETRQGRVKLIENI